MALTVWIFVSKVMSLLFNLLYRFVVAFLSRSKRLLISWLQSPSTVILEPKKVKSVTVPIFPLSILPGNDYLVENPAGLLSWLHLRSLFFYK